MSEHAIFGGSLTDAPQPNAVPETVIPEKLQRLYRFWKKDLEESKYYSVPTQCGIELIERIARAEATIAELNRKLEATLKDRNLCMESKAKLRTEFNSMKALREDASATGKESRNEF